MSDEPKVTEADAAALDQTNWLTCARLRAASRVSAIALLDCPLSGRVSVANGSAADAQLSGKRTVKSNAPIASSADSDRPLWPNAGRWKTLLKCQLRGVDRTLSGAVVVLHDSLFLAGCVCPSGRAV